jgi:hypothetical protein
MDALLRNSSHHHHHHQEDHAYHLRSEDYFQILYSSADTIPSVKILFLQTKVNQGKEQEKRKGDVFPYIYRNDGAAG